MNIPEGSARSSAKEFTHYLQIAIGSIFEIITALVIARNRKLLKADYYTAIYGGRRDSYEENHHVQKNHSQ